MIKNLRPALSFEGGDVAAWQARARPKLAELLGWQHMPVERPALKVVSLWKGGDPSGSIEKIAFQAESDADVLAYVCLPANAGPPYPWMICLQGHSTGAHVSIARQLGRETRPYASEGDRDLAIGCMKWGWAALCIEQRSMGERLERHQKQLSPHPCHDAAMRSIMLGRTLFGERVFDIDRGLDYLATRQDVDRLRVGVMGNSGGGVASIYAAALLPRLTLAMPSCSFCSFAQGIMSIYHCADNYIPGLLPEMEMADVLGLFAPRPVVVVAGREDDIFPIAGVRNAFAGLKKIYAAAGAPGHCRLVIGPGGHRFYADPAWSALGPMLKRMSFQSS